MAIAVPSTWPLTSLGTASHDAIDSHLFLWGFWWTKEAVEAFRSPYWTDLLLHPTGASLAFHSFPLPYNLISLPFQYLFPGPVGLVVAANVLTLVSFALSALAAYALSVRLTASRWCGLVAGLAFACMPYRLLNVARLHVLATEYLAAFVLAWILFTDSPTWRRATFVGLSLAATLYTSPRYALYVCGFVLLWLGYHAWWRADLRTKRFAAAAGVAVGVCVVAAAPLLLTQARAFARGDVLPTLSFDDIKFYSPALASFVTPTRIHPLYGSWFAFAGEYGEAGLTGMRSETTIGFTVGLLALLGLWRMRRDAIAFWAIAAACFLLLTLGPYLKLNGTTSTTIPLPYLALYRAAAAVSRDQRSDARIADGDADAERACRFRLSSLSGVAARPAIERPAGVHCR